MRSESGTGRRQSPRTRHGKNTISEKKRKEKKRRLQPRISDLSRIFIASAVNDIKNRRCYITAMRFVSRTPCPSMPFQKSRGGAIPRAAEQAKVVKTTIAMAEQTRRQQCWR